MPLVQPLPVFPQKRTLRDESGKIDAAIAALKLLGPDEHEGLAELRLRGWLLVDATYEPVDKNKRRDETIARDYPLLCDDLTRLSPDRDVPLVLIKANICRLLGPRLLADGFNVVNKGLDVYFPSHGNQIMFQRQFSAILRCAGLSAV